MQFETNYEESDSLYTQFCSSKLRRQRERERERERERDGTREKRQFHLPFEMERNRCKQE
jgi:hypothetical protein